MGTDTSKDKAEAIKSLYSQRDKFILIGLTGRTGSGCTTVAKILSKDNFQDLDLKSYNALFQLADRLRKYQKLVFVLVDDSMHPRSSRDFFERFCADQHLGCEVVSDIEGLQVRRGEVYIAIRQIDVVSIIKKSRVEGLQCGVDFGLIGYNDTPAYEVIDQGITALSVDWEKMGDKAAEFVLQGKTIQDYLPTEVRLRASL